MIPGKPESSAIRRGLGHRTVAPIAALLGVCFAACSITPTIGTAPATPDPAAVALLDSTLRSERIRGVRALEGSRSAASRALLLRALADPDGALRAEAVGALVHSGGDEALRAAVAVLADPQYQVRSAAAAALVKAGPRAVPALRVQATSRDWIARKNTLSVLAWIKAPAATPEIRAALEDPVPEVRVTAIFALAALREDAAIPRLREMLGHPEFPVRDRAAGMLSSFGEKGTTALLEELESPIASRRQVAALNLFAGPAPPDPDLFVARLVEERDPAVQSGLLAAFSRGKEPASCRALAGSLGKMGADLRVRAVGILIVCDDLPVDPVLAALGDADWRVRTGASRLAGRLRGSRAAEALTPLLADPHAEVRRAAASALGATGSRAALGPLLEAARSPDSTMRGAAFAALGKIGGEEAEWAIVSALGAESHEVLQGALEGFSALEQVRQPQVAAAQLVRCLERQAHPEGLHAALQKLGPAAVEPLLEVFAGGTLHARRRAAYELGHIRHPLAANDLVGALAKPYGEVTYQVVEALKRQGPAVERALVEGMRFTPPNVCADILDVLADLRSDAARTAIIEALEDPDGRVRARAAHHLGVLKESRAVPSLVRLMSGDPDDQVPGDALAALGNFDDPRARDALAALLVDREARIRVSPGSTARRFVGSDALEQMQETVRIDAMASLARLRDDRAEAAVLLDLHSYDMCARSAAVQAAGDLGTPAALGALVRAYSGLDPRSAESATAALTRHGSRPVPTLIEGLATPDPAVRAAFIAMLGQIGDVRALPELLSGIESGDQAEAIAAIRALGASRDDRGVQPLIMVLAQAGLRAPAAAALGRLGHRSALPALVDLLSDPDPQVRAAAENALAASTGKPSGNQKEFWLRWLEESGERQPGAARDSRARQAAGGAAPAAGR